MPGMNAYLIICGTVGLLVAIPGVAWALGAAERRIARRQYEQQVQEQQRRARASWQHTLKDLESESAERRPDQESEDGEMMEAPEASEPWRPNAGGAPDPDRQLRPSVRPHTVTEKSESACSRNTRNASR